MKIPEARYICEKQWDKEFEMAEYNETSYQLQADHTTWEKMLAFATSLANNPDEWYRHLWTSIDGEDGSMYLVNGTALVNRIDFWFSKKPWGIPGEKEINDKTYITVAWEDQEDCNKE